MSDESAKKRPMNMRKHVKAPVGLGNLKQKRPIRPYWVILALGIGLIVIGAFRHEFGTILLNALILCTSCIGLR